MTPFHTTSRTASLPLLLAALGCGSNLEPTVTVWEGELTALRPTSIAGSVAVLSQGGRSEVSITISNVDAGATFAWDLRAGACDEVGEILAGPAVYSPLEADDQGQASEQTIISESLRPSGTYSVRVRSADEAEEVACAALERVS